MSLIPGSYTGASASASMSAQTKWFRVLCAVLLPVMVADKTPKVLETSDDGCFLQHATRVQVLATEATSAEVPQSMWGAWLLQAKRGANCMTAKGDKMDCQLEAIHVLVVACSLCSAIMFVVCAFMFIREDKEEQITPLCPQLVVRQSDLKFRMDLDGQPGVFNVLDGDAVVCKVAIDWSEPRSGAVAATVRVQNNHNLTLATVVARNFSAHGQALALCRAGSEIFGFVEHDSDNRYQVRHRTGVHLLTLLGDFNDCDIDGLNPAGSKVCSINRMAAVYEGKVHQHVDAGLVICSFLATYIHRKLRKTVTNIPVPAALLPPTVAPSQQTQAAEEVPATTGGQPTSTGVEVVVRLPSADPFVSSYGTTQAGGASLADP